MTFKLEIQKVNNGFICTGFEDGSITVIEDQEDSLSAIESLLFLTMDHFGYYGSKHDPERIIIKREKNEP